MPFLLLRAVTLLMSLHVVVRWPMMWFRGTNFCFVCNHYLGTLNSKNFWKIVRIHPLELTCLLKLLLFCQCKVYFLFLAINTTAIHISQLGSCAKLFSNFIIWLFSYPIRPLHILHFNRSTLDWWFLGVGRYVALVTCILENTTPQDNSEQRSLAHALSKLQAC